MPWAGIVKTYNTNAQTPDSAGTATAMNSGYKTKTVSAIYHIYLAALTWHVCEGWWLEFIEWYAWIGWIAKYYTVSNL